MRIVEPILAEQWIVDGESFSARPSEEDALYIGPLLSASGLIPDDVHELHSLVLDNNVLADLVENRRPLNNSFLMNLLRSKPIELNPVFAMIEQRQKFSGATAALNAYADYLQQHFSWSAAKAGAASFDASLASAKEDLLVSVEKLAGYIGIAIFLYHQNAPASQKLEWLSGLVRSADLPYFQLHFYFAALLFLTKERPELFRESDLRKIREETKPESSIEKQKVKVLNLSNDLALPTVAIFQNAGPLQFVWPYIATRDRLVQLFLSEVFCDMVDVLPDGRANGSWKLRKTGVVHAHLGSAIEMHLPRRLEASSPQQKLMRMSRLRAFSDQYIQRCVQLRAVSD